MEVTFGGKYKLESEIGYGGCGTVYVGVHTVAGKEVAIKLEAAKGKQSLIRQESKIYKTLMGGPGVPWLMWSGKQGDYNVLVLDLLGPSLEDLFRMCNKHFSLKTILQLTDQLLTLIEYIHSRDWVHRDIKPANFLIGTNPESTSRTPNSDRINVVDFGFAKKYADSLTKEHIPFSQHDCNGVGTPLFASINTHRGEECSRRDDLESLAYTLIYFLRGTLPWRKLKPLQTKSQPVNPKQTWDRILKCKLDAEAAHPSPLTASLPEEFDVFYRYARGLQFDDLPDYEGCRKMFRTLAERHGIVYDGEFDWSVVRDRLGHHRSTSGSGNARTGFQRTRHCEACFAKAARATRRASTGQMRS